MAIMSCATKISEIRTPLFHSVPNSEVLLYMCKLPLLYSRYHYEYIRTFFHIFRRYEHFRDTNTFISQRIRNSDVLLYMCKIPLLYSSLSIFIHFSMQQIWLSWQNSELALDEVKSFFSLYYEDTFCDDVVMSQLKKSCQSLFCSIFLIIFYTLHTHIHTMDCKMEPDTYT